MVTNLDQLYSLRKDFSIVGLTGRTGSGCSISATILSAKFEDLKNLRTYLTIEESGFRNKFKIVHNYAEKNWKVYKTIRYSRVILLILLPALKDNFRDTLLFDHYRDHSGNENNNDLIRKLKREIQDLINKKFSLTDKIESIGNLADVKEDEKLKMLYEIFWGSEFFDLSESIDNILKENGLIERVMLLSK